MDTDELSEQTYKAIIIEAELFNHDLTLQFGVLSSSCKDEDDYIKKSLDLIEEMKTYDKIDLDDMFFGNPPEMKAFQFTLNKIEGNIKKVKRIPLHKRTYYYE